MTKIAPYLCVPMDCKRGDARGSQSLLLVGDGWSKLRFCCPHFTRSVKVHNRNLLGDVSVNHTSAVDVVCDCMRVSALCVCVVGGQHVGVRACACMQRVR